jgi:hypothetical protein
LKSSTEDESFVTASEYATSRSSSYHTASECRDHSPWWTDNAERSSVDLDSSDPEQVNVKSSLFSPPTYYTSGSFDNSEKSYRSPIAFEDQNEIPEKIKSESESSSESPPIPPKISSPIEEFPEPPPLISDKKMYTIFESPTSTPSQDGDVIGTNSPFKVSDDNNNLADMSGLSYYYQNIITKQVLKTCL